MSEKKPPRPDPELLGPALGAMIFASDEPVSPRELEETFRGVTRDEIESAFRQLQEELERGGSGLRVEEVAGGYRYATRPDVGAWVRHFMRQRNRARLSAAALETLAIVAYRQPVTAPEIQAIRGKDPSGPLRSLLDKKLLRILGKKKVVGSPLLYGTSKQFLIHFGLNSLEDLPSIDEFDQFVELLQQSEQIELIDEGAEAAEQTVEEAERETVAEPAGQTGNE